MGRALLLRSTSKRHQSYPISCSLGAPRHAGNSVTRSVSHPIRDHPHPDRMRGDPSPVSFSNVFELVSGVPKNEKRCDGSAGPAHNDHYH
jgi:hypothetical protein